jgi:anthranilate synthase component 1
MDFNRFKKYAGQYNVVPVYQRVTADMLTPVLAYLKMRQTGTNCFLLESVEGIGRWARYSFLGKNPVKIITNFAKHITIEQNNRKNEIEHNLFLYLKQEISQFSSPLTEDLPDFTGGVVGFLGYENIALIEDILTFRRQSEIGTPDAVFGIYDTIVAFDHFKHQLILITNVFTNGKTDLELEYKEAQNRLRRLRKELIRPLDQIPEFIHSKLDDHTGITDNFIERVKQSKQNIVNGDVFQIVLSRRFSATYRGDLFNVYRALRMINPSPYMYYMEFESKITVIGTSPEDLLKVKDRVATILPIAGTRPRGSTAKEDKRLETELRADPKENAEHVMLVDLARNDLGRICQYKTVKVTENKQISRYSHVMHLVSRVEGVLREDKDCIDALMAGFPAGTLTGAPKIRAIQLIDTYETCTRNVYGGAVGYIDFSGNLDMCIAIRTLFATDSHIYWQAGAGIVADSDPQKELQEIDNKSAVLCSALSYAEVIDEDIDY